MDRRETEQERIRRKKSTERKKTVLKEKEEKIKASKNRRGYIEDIEDIEDEDIEDEEQDGMDVEPEVQTELSTFINEISLKYFNLIKNKIDTKIETSMYNRNDHLNYKEFCKNMVTDSYLYNYDKFKTMYRKINSGDKLDKYNFEEFKKFLFFTNLVTADIFNKTNFYLLSLNNNVLRIDDVTIDDINNRIYQTMPEGFSLNNLSDTIHISIIAFKKNLMYYLRYIIWLLRFKLLQNNQNYYDNRNYRITGTDAFSISKNPVFVYIVCDKASYEIYKKDCEELIENENKQIVILEHNIIDNDDGITTYGERKDLSVYEPNEIGKSIDPWDLLESSQRFTNYLNIFETEEEFKQILNDEIFILNFLFEHNVNIIFVESDDYLIRGIGGKRALINYLNFTLCNKMYDINNPSKPSEYIDYNQRQTDIGIELQKIRNIIVESQDIPDAVKFTIIDSDDTFVSSNFGSLENEALKYRELYFEYIQNENTFNELIKNYKMNNLFIHIDDNISGIYDFNQNEIYKLEKNDYNSLYRIIKENIEKKYCTYADISTYECESDIVAKYKRKLGRNRKDIIFYKKSVEKTEKEKIQQYNDEIKEYLKLLDSDEPSFREKYIKENYNKEMKFVGYSVKYPRFHIKDCDTIQYSFFYFYSLLKYPKVINLTTNEEYNLNPLIRGFRKGHGDRLLRGDIETLAYNITYAIYKLTAQRSYALYYYGFFYNPYNARFMEDIAFNSLVYAMFKSLKIGTSMIRFMHIHADETVGRDYEDCFDESLFPANVPGIQSNFLILYYYMYLLQNLNILGTKKYNDKRIIRPNGYNFNLRLSREYSEELINLDVDVPSTKANLIMPTSDNKYNWMHMIVFQWMKCNYFSNYKNYIDNNIAIVFSLLIIYEYIIFICTLTNSYTANDIIQFINDNKPTIGVKTDSIYTFASQYSQKIIKTFFSKETILEEGNNYNITDVRSKFRKEEEELDRIIKQLDYKYQTVQLAEQQDVQQAELFDEQFATGQTGGYYKKYMKYKLKYINLRNKLMNTK